MVKYTRKSCTTERLDESAPLPPHERHCSLGICLDLSSPQSIEHQCDPHRITQLYQSLLHVEEYREEIFCVSSAL